MSSSPLSLSKEQQNGIKTSLPLTASEGRLSKLRHQPQKQSWSHHSWRLWIESVSTLQLCLAVSEQWCQCPFPSGQNLHSEAVLSNLTDPHPCRRSPRRFWCGFQWWGNEANDAMLPCASSRKLSNRDALALRLKTPNPTPEALFFEPLYKMLGSAQPWLHLETTS